MLYTIHFLSLIEYNIYVSKHNRENIYRMNKITYICIIVNILLLNTYFYKFVKNAIN